MNFLVLCLTALICWITPWRSGLPLDPAAAWVDEANRLAQQRSRVALWWTGLAIAVPMVLLLAVLWMVEGVAYGLLTLCTHVGVLLACVSRTDPLGAMTVSMEKAWLRGDQQAAALIAERDWSIQVDNVDELGRAVRTRVTLETLRGYCVPAFWYVLLGPVAALGYRLTWEVAARRRPGSGAAAEAVQALDWLPLRLLGISLAMVGRYRQTNGALRRRLIDWDTPGEVVAGELIESALENTGQAAPLLRATRRWLLHSLLVWAIVIAIASLLG